MSYFILTSHKALTFLIFIVKKLQKIRTKIQLYAVGFWANDKL